MRLFLAIDLPASVRSSLEACRRGVSEQGWPATRWVRPETLHVTLVFLGDVDPALVPQIDRAVEPVFASRQVMTGRLGSAGAFPLRGKVRVLWVGFETDGDLDDLHRDLESSLAAIDVVGAPLYEPEARPFQPHVTLARCRTPWLRADVDRWIDAFGDPGLSFPIRRGTLFESHLSSSGPRYRAVSTYSLSR
ncbi:MAG: RNA 2',3'-cyclic phosphodiesterase [Thermoanaerobaculia bacterium]|nr:RNA 2',3'-cyclic phosphodiesterase [Thermoanaerobaculia bacterium]